MARIAGVDLPRDKKIQYALPYIFGIGPSKSVRILAETGKRAKARPAAKVTQYVVVRHDLEDIAGSFNNKLITIAAHHDNALTWVMSSKTGLRVDRKKTD